VNVDVSNELLDAGRQLWKNAIALSEERDFRRIAVFVRKIA